ncbi:MAG: 30S ribosomal protein S6 [Desulfobacteraceae bacterium]|jgi:small subunit ribosomal protein S6|nr:30S ribosomal protein S6 [Desulfobacteraceae bacterium]
MRRYETIFIVDPDLSEEGRVPLFDRIQQLIPDQGGSLLEIDAWGMRRMAYEVKGRVRGYYTRLDYCGTGDTVDEIERFFRIDDRILKYLTVMTEETPDVEQLQMEMAAARKAEAQTSEDTETPSAAAPQPAEPETPSESTEGTPEEE